MVADVSSLASMAAKLGAIYLSQEKEQDLAQAQHPVSSSAKLFTHFSTNQGNTVSNVTRGISPSLVKGGPTPGVLRKTKVAPKRKTHSLPSKVVNWVKRSL